MSSYWHPFADMGAVEAAGELSIVRGKGSHVWDAGGRRYLDATASLWYCNVGHGRTEIVEAVAKQMRELEAFSTFQDLTNPAVAELVERVASLAPVPGSKVFLTSGGSDSIDTATKMVRRYWHLRGQSERSVFIRRERAYHGMHAAGTSLGGLPANAEGHGTLLADVAEVPWDDADALSETIARLDGTAAAFFCEPVIGAGGVFAPPSGYLDSVRRACRDAGVLFIADEVITGFGRTGDWFASTRWNLEPDIVTCAKGITSGYLPLGAVIAAPAVWEPFYAEGAGMWRHGYTYSGHAAVAAAAIANLDVIEREQLLARAVELEGALAEGLGALASHELVSEIRAGTGVLAAVQLDPARLASDPGLLPGVVPACRANGVMTRTLATGAIHISPPLVLADDELDALVDGLAGALDDLQRAPTTVDGAETAPAR
ncbi:MAG TPA: aminotransferase class III-fold pyridoxal phosphate-dependent enzyme [Actinomycetota bacterium]|nr:aminotransferase class III-fold pyridoxal phosphate-dependent enzyme [Actinomycetota bacterium]